MREQQLKEREYSLPWVSLDGVVYVRGVLLEVLEELLVHALEGRDFAAEVADALSVLGAVLVHFELEPLERVRELLEDLEVLFLELGLPVLDVLAEDLDALVQLVGLLPDEGAVLLLDAGERRVLRLELRVRELRVLVEVGAQLAEAQARVLEALLAGADLREGALAHHLDGLAERLDVLAEQRLRAREVSVELLARELDDLVDARDALVDVLHEVLLALHDLLLVVPDLLLEHVQLQLEELLALKLLLHALVDLLVDALLEPLDHVLNEVVLPEDLLHLDTGGGGS